MSVHVKIRTASDAGKTMWWTCDRCMVSTQNIPLCLEYLSQWRGLNLRVCLYHLSSSSIWFYPTFASCSSMIICWLLVAYRGVQSDRLDHQSTLQPSLVHLLVFFPLLAMETTSLQKHVSFCFFWFFKKSGNKTTYLRTTFTKNPLVSSSIFYCEKAGGVFQVMRLLRSICLGKEGSFATKPSTVFVSRSVKNVRSLWGSDCNHNPLSFVLIP